MYPTSHGLGKARRIPGTDSTVEVATGPYWVKIRRGPLTATVLRTGEFDLDFDSKILIRNFMTKDEEKTREIRGKFQTPGVLDIWEDYLRHWAEPPPMLSFRHGQVVSTWPEGPDQPRRIVGHGLDTTTSWARKYYKGSVFRFVHFETKEGQEGAVIQWGEDGDRYGEPEVWIGKFEEFMSAQSLYQPGGTDEFLEFNGFFENGFMWALEKLGAFDEPPTVLTQEVLEAIAEDPEALPWASVDKMLLRFGEYPTELQEALAWMQEIRPKGGR